MITRNLSEEITSVFEYIRDVICVEQPYAMVNEFAFIKAVLNKQDSLAYQALSSILIESTLEQMREFYNYQITYTSNDSDDNKSPYSLFDEYISDCDGLCKKYNLQHITSSVLLLSILKSHEKISCQFRDFSVTTLQLTNCVINQIKSLQKEKQDTAKKHIKRPKSTNNNTTSVKIINNVQTNDNELDRSLTNISKLASLGKVDKVICYDKYYQELFKILSKKQRNNVLVCGKNGVGKTAFVKNLANIINEKKCKPVFHEKVLVELDFSKLVIGTQFKGLFEQKFYNIINKASEGNYIFFVDNLNTLLNGNSRYAETDMDTLLDALFTNPSIQVVCTMNLEWLSKFKKSSLSKYLQELTIEEPSIDETFNIITQIKSQYESYHCVSYDDSAVSTCIELCKKYPMNTSLPYSAIDVLDNVGAATTFNLKEKQEIVELKKRQKEINNEIQLTKESSQTKEYDKIDVLTKELISTKSKIALLEKEEILSKEPTLITKNDICTFISKKIDIPLDELTQPEKIRLKGLNVKLKDKVIGQDEAIDEVCRVVKRQRVGLGENNRPSVLMFLGSTGTGKTYLAKQLAKEVFGNEKYLVRMDMSEYADKTSVSKINGSNPGYVGYEDTTFLTKALKKKKRFVLLLDEFEKSNEEVHNVFLQMFDEGRFTDNHGEEYSLKDIIIILTSNVGATEAANRGKSIGFNNSDLDLSQDIIEKELKRKFKPEFLNRIQKIIYFNKLNDTNLRDIIKLEVNKIQNKIEGLGYHLSNDITNTQMIDDIYTVIHTKKEYGARPVVNEVQRRIEDAIVDYLIDNDVENGHTFTYEELTNKF